MPQKGDINLPIECRTFDLFEHDGVLFLMSYQLAVNTRSGILLYAFQGFFVFFFLHPLSTVATVTMTV
jgi:hypothetical protein